MPEQEPYMASISRAYELLFGEAPNFNLSTGDTVAVILGSPRLGELPQELRVDLAEIVLEGPPMSYSPGHRGPAVDEAQRILGRTHPSVTG